MSFHARKDVYAHMAPRDAAAVVALAQACDLSNSAVARALMCSAMFWRGWLELRPLEVERQTKLRETLQAMPESKILTLIPGLPRNGPRSSMRVSLNEHEHEILCRMQTSKSNAARSLIEEALEHLQRSDEDVGPHPDQHALEDAKRAMEAIAAIQDPEVRRAFVGTVESMASLCGGANN